MVVLEPSCCSVFRDDMRALMPDSPRAKQLAENTFTLAEFLEKHAPGYRPPELKRKAIVQAHCHHKAVMRLKEEKAVLQKLGLDYELLEAGCCGMAGSFGYEKDKYEVSLACGERALLPRVRKAGLATVIIADGFSCKEQIQQQSHRHALHLAEVLDMAIHDGGQGRAVLYPERTFVEARKAAQKRSLVAAGAIAGLTLGACILGLWMAGWKRRPVP